MPFCDVCISQRVGVRFSPGVSERLLTGETLGWVFFHEVADEILGWETSGHKTSVHLDTQNITLYQIKTAQHNSNNNDNR